MSALRARKRLCACSASSGASGRPLNFTVRRQGSVPLRTSDRQTLIGPAVIGALFGALSALGVVAVRSEYGNHMEPVYPGVTSLAAEAVLTFALVTAGILLTFGAVPLLIKRLMSRHARGSDA